MFCSLTEMPPVTSWRGTCATRGVCGEEYLSKTSRDGLMEGGSSKRRSSGTRSNTGTDRACRHVCTCDRLNPSCAELLCWLALQLACLECPTKDKRRPATLQQHDHIEQGRAQRWPWAHRTLYSNAKLHAHDLCLSNLSGKYACNKE